MPFTFQSALRVLQQPHKHSHSFQLANHTQLAHHHVPFFFTSKRISSKYCMANQSTKMAHERAASHIKVTYPPCLFQLPPWGNVNRSTTLINNTLVMSSHNYSWEKLHNFADQCFWPWGLNKATQVIIKLYSFIFTSTCRDNCRSSLSFQFWIV